MGFNYDNMTDEQKKALENLRRAAKRAGRAGLVAFGCSGLFNVYPREWDIIERGHVNALPTECLITEFHCDGGDT